MLQDELAPFQQTVFGQQALTLRALQVHVLHSVATLAVLMHAVLVITACLPLFCCHVLEFLFVRQIVITWITPMCILLSYFNTLH